ncbi:coiled-coil domain-containing protein [Streptomyces spongiae]|uniref:Uncharacterized protein n=1 Tax=Streptomyces spongiae TaxID=565072 RepID=A0A5N8XEQ2_9ACTN|nr:hypothetical protein [Streptomyces spongiae]MPY57919.1 hypothetical protein [Streptomyces spongiae]
MADPQSGGRRLSIDYDLMYELARHVWHLRDEMDIESQSKRTFARSDIGNRKQTTEALTDFYGDWRKSFQQAWQVFTDLGNLLDEIGKNFYDADAGTASSAAQQAASLHRAQAESDRKAYEQRMDAKRKKVQADDIRMRYAAQETRLKQQEAELAKKRAALEKKQEALEKRQQELDEKNKALEKEQEPLRKRQEELQERQQALWRTQLEERTRQDAAQKAEQDALDAKFKALDEEQEPLRQRQEELQEKQQALWREEADLRKKQEAAFLAQQAVLQREQDSYDAKQSALQKKQQALWAERNALLRKNGVTQGELDAWQKKQDALTAEQDALWKQEGEPLQKKWDALEESQREQAKAFEPLERRQRELDSEQQAILKDQEPLEKRQAELLGEQKALWKEHDAERKKLAEGQEKEQELLNSERDDLSRDQDGFQPRREDLQKQQEDLWKEQPALDQERENLDKADEDLRKRSDELKQSKADDLEEMQKEKPWTPDSGRPDPLYQRRGQDRNPEAPPPDAPKSFRQTTENGTTEVTYKLDQNGEVELDKDGNPIETTTTVTNSKNGMVYSETYRKLPGDGDSVTTTRTADGTVTKVYMDADSEGGAPGESMRYVTDEKGRPLQMWSKMPDGEWGLVWQWEDTPSGQEDVANGVGRPPAYLTVEKPLVDGGGSPADAPSSPRTTTELPGGNTRTDYTLPDGSVLKVVTTETTRYVADGNNEIQEIWYKNRNGTWYLKESITQHTRYGDEPPLGRLGGT